MIILIGALTSKVYSFTNRSWEINKTESIDLFDSIGTKIVLNVNSNKILRIEPEINFISDRVRFSFDSLYYNRLKNYYFNNINLYNSNNFLFSELDMNFCLKKIMLNYYFFKFCAKYGNYTLNINGFLGDLNSLNSIIFLKFLLNKLGSNNIYLNKNLNTLNSIDINSYYLMNLKKIKKIDSSLFIGTDLRIENPILNLNIRDRFLKNKLKIFTFGSMLNPLFLYYNLGNNILNLIKFLEGSHKFSMQFICSQNSNIFFSSSLLVRQDGNFLWMFINQICKKYNQNINLNFLHLDVTYSNLIELGFNYKKELKNHKKRLNLNFFLGGDYIKNEYFFFNNFNIYIGSIGFSLIKKFNIIFPVKGLYEKQGFFMNNFGVCKEIFKSISNNFLLTEEEFFLKILQNLNIFSYKEDCSIKNYISSIYSLDSGENFYILSNQLILKMVSNGFGFFLSKKPFESFFSNNFMVNVFLKNSKIIAENYNVFQKKINVSYNNLVC